MKKGYIIPLSIKFKILLLIETMKAKIYQCESVLVWTWLVYRCKLDKVISFLPYHTIINEIQNFLTNRNNEGQNLSMQECSSMNFIDLSVQNWQSNKFFTLTRSLMWTNYRFSTSTNWTLKWLERKNIGLLGTFDFGWKGRQLTITWVGFYILWWKTTLFCTL